MMKDYLEIFKFITDGGLKKAPQGIRDFVTAEIECEFDGFHRDYIEFSKQYCDLFLGNEDASIPNHGDVFFSFYPVEDSFWFDDPFKNGFFYFAASQENVEGENVEISFYLNLSRSRVDGVYIAKAEEVGESEYKLVSKTFLEFLDSAIQKKGKFYAVAC
ncbi:hypothetical protein ACG1BZ_04935 [Microbulbifer sp. CNSA002]|uniref:hypothetical protein n=1 Tax=Microbulbifer sp. CNSA002 TaxID=3373604 RepID=UPI0039B36EEA